MNKSKNLRQFREDKVVHQTDTFMTTKFSPYLCNFICASLEKNIWIKETK